MRLLQCRFWEILTVYYEQKLDFPIGQLSQAEEVQEVAAISHWMTNYFFDQSASDLKATANQMIDAVYNDGHIFICWRNEERARHLPVTNLTVTEADRRCLVALQQQSIATEQLLTKV